MQSTDAVLERRPSKATVAERYAHATQTTDLTVHLNERCDADVLLAAGYAASKDRRRGIALQVYRMAVRQDLGGLSVVAEEVGHWLQGRLSRKGNRPVPKLARDALVLTVLRWWLKPACTFCNGTGYDQIEDTPNLSAHECDNCHGTGKSPVARLVPGPLKAHAEWLGKELDDLVLVVHGDMAKLLASSFDMPARTAPMTAFETAITLGLVKETP